MDRYNPAEKPCPPIEFSISKKLPPDLANKRGAFCNRMFYTGESIHVKIWEPDETMRKHSSEEDLIKVGWLKAKAIAERDNTQIELFLQHGHLDERGFFWTDNSQSLGEYCGKERKYF